MAEVGFIHFDCFCGADLYYLDSGPGSEAEAEAKSVFSRLIYVPHFAVFTDSDRSNCRCPHCGAEIELPDQMIMSYLRQRSHKDAIRERMDGLNQAVQQDWLPSV